MKTRNTFWALALLAAAGFLFNVARASASESYSRNFGMTGITLSQTARLSVVSVDNPDLRPVRVELLFLDNQGRVLAQSQETLLPGQAALLDLRGVEAARGVNRAQIRAQVRFVDNPDIRVAQKVLPTLEVIDNASGRTTVVVPLRDDPFFQPAN